MTYSPVLGSKYPYLFLIFVKFPVTSYDFASAAVEAISDDFIGLAPAAKAFTIVKGLCHGWGGIRQAICSVIRKRLTSEADTSTARRVMVRSG